MKAITSLALLICAAAALAQAPPPPPVSGQTYPASQYSGWTGYLWTGNTATGAQTVYTTIRGATGNLPALTTNLPILFETGTARAETLTPTVVQACASQGSNCAVVQSCNFGSQFCAVTATFGFTHAFNTPITSGTFGIQEAINVALANGGGTVLVDSTYLGPAGAALILAAKGTTAVTIQDTRANTIANYAWNGSAYAATGAAGQQTYILDSYLSTADGHGGQDYGYAASAFCAAIGCSTMQNPVKLITTAPGICKVFSTINLPGPIQFDASSCALVPQSTMASSYVTLSSCSSTMGSNTVTCTSTAGLVAGMAVGGDLTLGPANYIASVTNGTTFQLALAASRSITAVIQPLSNTVVGVDSLQDVAAGQVWNNIYFAGGTTVSSIAYGATQSLVMSSTSTSGSAIPLTLTLNAGTVVSGLTLNAIKQTPVILVPQAPNALEKPHGPNFDASLSNVIINDPTYSFAQNSFGRSLAGVVGVQIFGYDNYKVLNLSVNGLNGSGLVLGGYVSATNNNGAVRESDFTHVYVYSSGDKLTGQPAVAFMTGLGSNAINSGADEINQLGFSDLHIINPDSENLVIGSYLHTGNNGPRLIWFTGDTQFEGGINPYYFGNADTVRILNGGKTIRFNGGEYVTPGFGKAVFHVTSGTDVSVTGGNLGSNGGVSSVYNVTIANGSPTVTYVSAGTNGSTTGFPATQYINGVGALLNDGASCLPCTVWLIPTGAVNAGRTQLTLATNYAGAATSATLTLNTGGYFFNLDSAGSLSQLTTLTNTYLTVGSTVGTMLGANLTTQLFLVGQNALTPPPVMTDYPTNGGGFTGPVTLSPSTALNGPSNILHFQSWYPNGSGVQTQSDVQWQLFIGSGNNPTQQMYLKCVICANDFYANYLNQASGFGIQQNLTSTGANKATFGTFGSTQGWSSGMNNSTNWTLRDTTNSLNAITVTPATDAIAYLGPQTAPAFFPQSLAAGPFVSYFDEFMTQAAVSGGSVGGTAGALFLTSINATANHVGILRVQSSTTVNTGEVASGPTGQGMASVNSAPAWTWESSVFPNALPATTASSYQAGMAATFNVSPWTTGLGFFLSSTNAAQNDWYCEYASTLVDSTVAATAAWTRLTMVNDGTLVHWYVNGTQVCGTGIAFASIPGSFQVPAWTAVTNLGGTAVQLDVDYLAFQRQTVR